MYKNTWIIIAILAILVGCGDKNETQNNTDNDKEKAEIVALQKEAKKVFGVLPDKMPGSENDTPELVALGKKLYFEKRLSGNDTISCNSCHRLDANMAGVDNLPTSPGTQGVTGDRNSPTVYNAGFHFVQFWDGRAKDLVEQAKGPILNPVEMEMASEEATVAKIAAIEEYPALFKTAFPNIENSVTYENIAVAIAAFERTLITRDRFDDFQNGDVKALTKEERVGLHKFIQTGCIQCHKGPAIGGDMYNKTGLLNPYEDQTDLGRFNETKVEVDKFVFKVPSLRNIALTGPYFHDGKVATLEEAVEKIAYLQLNKKLTSLDVKYIVKFLHALSDKKLASGPVAGKVEEKESR